MLHVKMKSKTHFFTAIIAKYLIDKAFEIKRKFNLFLHLIKERKEFWTRYN